jgi:hypothetical protein
MKKTKFNLINKSFNKWILIVYLSLFILVFINIFNFMNYYFIISQEIEKLNFKVIDRHFLGLTRDMRYPLDSSLYLKLETPISEEDFSRLEFILIGEQIQVKLNNPKLIRIDFKTEYEAGIQRRLLIKYKDREIYSFQYFNSP